MPSEYYKEALKLGQREFRACVARGEHPYLPALEDFMPAEKLSKGSDLGVTTVPLEFLVGTCHQGRTQAFARNYMPLMAEGSEFADKWRQLCKAHLEEGIHSPVQVYEYLNRYYVEEGNKRVSVLKFFGGQTVEARVFRVLPERNGSREAEVYYELLEFAKYSGVSFLEFSKPGSYAALQRLMGKEPEEPWSEEERKKFTAAYYYFRQAYEANGGKKLSTTVGDALLAYVKVYGYPRLRNYAPADLRQTVAKACGLSLFSDSGQVNLAMPVWNWGVYYESILRRIRSGAFQREYEESSKALNYYWGMSAGVVGVSCADKVPPETQKLAWLLQDGVCGGVFEPFSGPIFTQDGTKVAQDHRSLSPEQIINMDYLVEGIEGDIPAYETLSELGKATARIAGIGRLAGEAEQT